MSLKDVKQPEPICCERFTPIRDVSQLMRRHNIGCVLVVANGAVPVGIVTDRDLVVRCMADGIDYSNPVEKVMSQNLVTVTVDDGIHDVVEKMKRNSVRRIPVLDRLGKAVGIISSGDMMGLLSQEIVDVSQALAPQNVKLTHDRTHKAA